MVFYAGVCDACLHVLSLLRLLYRRLHVHVTLKGTVDRTFRGVF